MSAHAAGTKWSCPNDRELMLRSRLSDGRGWCTRSASVGARSLSVASEVSDEERAIIEAKLKMAQEFERIEANRVMLMLTKLDRIRKGPTLQSSQYMCELCGTAFNFVTKLQLKLCGGCHRRVCKSCGYTSECAPLPPSGCAGSPALSPSADRPRLAATASNRRSSPGTTIAMTGRQALHQGEKTDTGSGGGLMEKLWICLYCSECQEVWKKSGAWFHGGVSTELLTQASHTLTEVSSYTRSRVSDTRRSTALAQISGDDLARLTNIAGACGPHDDDEDDDDEETDEELELNRARLSARSRRREVSSSSSFPPEGSRRRTDHAGAASDRGNTGFVDGVESGDIRNRTKAFSALQEMSPGMRRQRKVKLSQRRAHRPDGLGGDEVDGGSDGTPSSALASQNSSPLTERRRKGAKQGQTVFKRTGKVSVRTNIADGSSSDDAPGVDTDMDIDALVSEVKTKEKIARSTSNPNQKKKISVAGSMDGRAGLGVVSLSLSYDTEESTLSLNLHQCSGLKGMDRSGFSDPFVIVQLISGGKCLHEKRTAVVKRSLDPVFNERFTFHAISEVELREMTVRLLVYDHDRVTKDDFIGEVALSMASINPDTVDSFRLELQGKNEELSRLERVVPECAPNGKILISLNYLSIEQVLLVKILRAVGLPSMDTNGLADPYVKCYLYPDKNKNSKQKTKIVSKTLDPEFNEEFRYPIKRSELRGKTLAITVWDYDWNSANDFIGGVYLSDSETGTCLKHFIDTVTLPNCLHTVWHTLQAERRKF